MIVIRWYIVTDIFQVSYAKCHFIECRLRLCYGATYGKDINVILWQMLFY